MAKKQVQKPNKRTTPIWLWVGLALALVVVVVLVLTNGAGKNGAALPKEISVAQAVEMRSAGAFILDVREPSEWQQGHIPGATLIPLGELASLASELPQDQKIVVVCRSGNRSAQGRDILLEAGFKNVTSMTGGMNQWQAAGLEMISGK